MELGFNGNVDISTAKYQIPAFAKAKVRDAAGVEKLVETAFPTFTLDEAGIEDARSFKGFAVDGDFNPFTMQTKTRDSGLAFLVGELEKRDTTIYEPLTTYYHGS